MSKIKQAVWDKVEDGTLEDETTELDEFKMEVQSRYDEYLQNTEKRGASWGEVAYIENLNQKELEGLLKEIDNETNKEE